MFLRILKMTAKLWYVYAEDLVANYLHTSRAVRTNYIDLFIFILGKINSIVFAHTDQSMPDMVLYFLQLLNIERTHPGLKQQLQNGAFSVRLYGKSINVTSVGPKP